MNDRRNHNTARIEGIFLVILGIAMVWFSLFGNYEYIMNPKFRWLTITGASMVTCMGVVLLVIPRAKAGLSALMAFFVITAVVLIGKPYAYDVNSLTLPDMQGIKGVRLTIGDTRYDFVGLQEMSTSIVIGKEGYDGRRIVVTGLLKRTPELDQSGQVAVMRPFSICCAADALMVGMRAEGSADSSLTDQWVNIYGTIVRLDEPLPSPKLRHGAIRYAAVSEIYVLAADSIEPYIRPRPKAGIIDKLASGKFKIFGRLAEKAGLESMLEDHEMVTVLAPVDAAFEALPDGTVEDLMKSENRELLIALVGRHVLVGLLTNSDLRELDEVVTITGETIPVTLVNGKLRAGSSRFLFKNIEVRDGVIHAIYPVMINARPISVRDRSADH